MMLNRYYKLAKLKTDAPQDARHPRKTREYKIEGQSFISKFSNPYVYLGEYSSSGSEDGITISNIKLGGKKMGIYFRKDESENYNLGL